MIDHKGCISRVYARKEIAQINVCSYGTELSAVDDPPGDVQASKGNVAITVIHNARRRKPVLLSIKMLFKKHKKADYFCNLPFFY